MSVGAGVGGTTGFADGLSVGSSVGRNVGRGVGSADGLSVGDGVGNFVVGLSVGVSTTAGQCHSHPNLSQYGMLVSIGHSECVGLFSLYFRQKHAASTVVVGEKLGPRDGVVDGFGVGE